MSWVDLHCHLLPGLDDGAKTPEISYAMAQAAVASGVEQIICTPHCTAGDPKIMARIARIQKAVAILNYVFQEKKLPLRLHAGMELLCNEQLPQVLERKEVLTLAESRYMLIEFRFDTTLSFIERAAAQVQQAGYIPVLAHPERYAAVWRDPDCMSVWFYRGYVLQLDKDSILNRFGDHCARTADWALRHGVAHIVASDAHDIRFRTPDLQYVYNHILQYYGRPYADLLILHNPVRIVQNQEMIPS